MWFSNQNLKHRVQLLLCGTLTVTASPCLFSKKKCPIMPLNQNVHQTVTRFVCVGFSMYACRFSVPQIGQFCLFTYPPRSKLASSEKMLFFAKNGIFCKSIAGPLSEAYTSVYTTIFVRRKELSVAIHEIRFSWKKMLDGGPYMSCPFTNLHFKWQGCVPLHLSACWTIRQQYMYFHVCVCTCVCVLMVFNP